MDYCETKEKIFKIFDNPNSLIQIMSNDQLNQLRNVMSGMVAQLDRLLSGEAEEIPVDTNLLADVQGVAKLFLFIALYEPITSDFTDFAETYLSLVFNWNNNIAKEDNLDTTITAILHLVRSTLTIQEAISALRKLTHRAEMISRFAPPSFEQSRHYLEILSRELEGAENK